MATLIPAAPHERPAVHRARTQIAAVVGAALTATALEAAAKIRRRKRREADEFDDDQIDQQTADDVSKGVDLTSIIVPVGGALGYVMQDQAARVLGKIGDLAAIEPDAQRAAVKTAQDQSARLVGMKYAPDGSLVENLNPRWSVTQSTRDLLNDLISKGVAEGQTKDQIADSIVTSAGFSESRARMIATTEVSSADNTGALIAFRTARDKGNVPLKKVWVCGGDDPCQDCLDNQDAGAIDLDDSFPDGSDSPPSHPSCFCGISAAIDGED